MTDIPQRTDVLVIGGGPSGCIASGLLSQSGFDVVLLEKAKHPRPAVGESILPHFWRFCDMIEGATERIQQAEFVRKAGAIAAWEGIARRTRFQDFNHTRPSLHVDRDMFDHILLGCSRDQGTRVFEQTTVTRVDVEAPQRIAVRYRAESGEEGKIVAKHVVDASGQSAVVARQFGFREFDEALRFTAMWGYFRTGSYLDYDVQHCGFESRFESPPVTFIESIGDWGWTWYIVLRNCVSVGVIVPPEKLREVKAKHRTLESRYLALVAEARRITKLLEGAAFIPGSVTALRDYAYKPVRLAMDGCYLVGDAAAFVDPINSAGVTFAMYAGFLAAWAIEGSLHRPERSVRNQEFFEFQYRHRLHIFRLIAVPPDRDFGEAQMQEVREGLRFFSKAEKQLALTTSFLTHRQHRIRNVLEQLEIDDAAIYDEVSLPPTLT